MTKINSISQSTDLEILESFNINDINLSQLAEKEYKEKIETILDISITYSSERLHKEEDFTISELKITYKSNYKIKTLSGDKIELGDLNLEKIKSLINKKINNLSKIKN